MQNSQRSCLSIKLLKHIVLYCINKWHDMTFSSDQYGFRENLSYISRLVTYNIIFLTGIELHPPDHKLGKFYADSPSQTSYFLYISEQHSNPAFYSKISVYLTINSKFCSCDYVQRNLVHSGFFHLFLWCRPCNYTFCLYFEV